MDKDKKRKIILDVDPGVDDAFAIAMAAYEETLEILAIHTVAGNVTLEHTTKNARGFAKLLGLDVPIAKGASEPLVFEPFYAAEVHGENGFGDIELDDLAPLSSKTAMESYVDILSNTEEKVTIVATGPLTNVALLLKSYPHLKEKIEGISLMGGGLKGGNTTSAGEFNFFYDPHAAHIVLNSELPIVMASLDATEQSEFRQKDAERLKREGGAVGELLHDISQAALTFNAEANAIDFMSLHDVIAVLYLVQPNLFTTKDAIVHVAYDSGVMRGFSHADVRKRAEGEPNAKVMVGLDKEAFLDYVLKKIIQANQ
ncbi:MAG TPA: nucleoside hydrolase [Atopostipes sp.]|nr:nucleoside hydrolase [Atopostipes sp.]